MYKFALIIIGFFSVIPSIGQDFKKESLTKQDKANGVLGIYTAGNFETLIRITLYKDKRFYYQFQQNEYDIFSRGKWTKEKDIIVLNSEIDSNDVPIKLLFFQTDTIKTFYIRTSVFTDTNPPSYNTKFQVPINLKSELLPDAMIYINNDTTYCFPFFDTCVGTYHQVKRIKVTFGNGFKSRWTNVDQNDFKRLLCIAQVDFLFVNYQPYRNFRLKSKGNKLIPLN